MADSRNVFAGLSWKYLVISGLVLALAVMLIAMFSASARRGIKWSGMTVKPLQPAEAQAQGLPPDFGGVMVKETGGAAENAGFQEGDVVVAVNGRPVQTLEDFSRLTRGAEASAGAPFLDVFRDGVQMSLCLAPPAARETFERPRPGNAAPGIMAAGRPASAPSGGFGNNPFCRVPAAGRPSTSLRCLNCGTRLACPRALAGGAVMCPCCNLPMVQAQ
jgi:hypothetical protein